MAGAEVVRLQRGAAIDVFDPGSDRRPKNVRAEKAVIGTILNRNLTLDRVIDLLQPEAFSDRLLGNIYGEIRQRLVNGIPVAADTIVDWVSMDGTFNGDERRGTQYLSELLNCAVSIDIRGFAETISNCSVRRQVIEASEKAIAAAMNPRLDISAEVTKLTAGIDGAAQGASRYRTSTFDEALDAAINEAAESQARGDAGGLPLRGWPRLARSLVMKPKELTCLAAIPGGGKSGLGWQLAIGMAREFRDSGKPVRETGGVLGFSLEMSASALATRALATVSGVSAWKIHRGEINEAEMNHVKAAREELRGLPLELLDINGLGKEAVKSLMYRQKLRWGHIALTIVDHCNLLTHGDYGAKHGTAAGTSDVADSMLHLAKTFDTHMLALVQLNLKDLKARKDHRPGLGDMRYSSNFEQNANNVLFIHRESQWLSDQPPDIEPGEDRYAYEERKRKWEDRRDSLQGVADLIVEKVRMGPANHNIKLLFDPVKTSFCEDPKFPL